MLYINCGNHVHLVMGDMLLPTTNPGDISWPLYSLDEVTKLLDILLRKECDPEKKQKIKTLHTKVNAWARVQVRNKKGQFTKERNLPSSQFGQMGVIDTQSRVSAWHNFQSGKEKMCNFILLSMLGDFLYPLSDCKFIKYHKEPSNELDRFKEPEWSGEFQIPTDF